MLPHRQNIILYLIFTVLVFFAHSTFAQTTSTGLVGQAVAPSLIAQSTTPAILAQSATPGLIGQATAPSLLAQSAAPSIFGQSATPSLLAQTATPGLIAQTAAPSLIAQSATPSLLAQSATPGMIGQSTVPNLIAQTATPSLLAQSASPNLIGQAVTPNLIAQAATPNLVAQAAATSIIAQASTPSLIAQAATPNLIAQAATPALVAQATSPGLVGQAAAPSLLAQTVSPGLIAQASPPGLMGQSSTPSLIGQSSTPSLIGQSSNPSLIGQAATPGLLGQAATSSLLGQSAAFRKIQTSPIIPLALPQTPTWYSFGRTAQAWKPIEGKYFFIRPPLIGAKLSYEFKDETNTRAGSEITDSYHEFSERISFTTIGWVYHPTIMKYTLEFSPEFTQGYEDMDPDKTNRINMFSPDYGITATFFDPKPYTLRLFASRREEPIWVPFQPGVEALTHTYGGDIDYNHKFRKFGNFHSRFGYQHSDYETDSFFNQQTITDNYTMAFQHGMARTTSGLTAVYTDVEQETQALTTSITSPRTETVDVKFNNNFRYRIAENNDRLYTSAYYRWYKYRNVENKIFNVTSTLNYKIRKKLDTLFRIGYRNSEDNDGFHNERYAAGAQLDHQLYDNLRTRLGLKTSLSDTQFGSQGELDPFLHLTYNRRTSWGHIRLSSKWDYDYTRRNYDDSQLETVRVLNEKIVLNDLEETLIANNRVIPATIIVSNSQNTIFYIENIDYRIDLIGDYVRIVRLPLGAINNGQPVLVNYNHILEKEYDDGKFSQAYAMQVSLYKSLRLGYTISMSDRHVISGTPPPNLDDNIAQTGTIQYTIGTWSDSQFNVRDLQSSSNANDSTAWNVRQQFRFKFFNRMLFKVSGNYGEVTHDQHDYVTEHYGFGSNINWRIARGLRFSFEGFYQHQSSRRDETDNIGIRSYLEYRYRIWSAKLYYELTNQRFESSDFERIRHLIRLDLIRLQW